MKIRHLAFIGLALAAGEAAATCPQTLQFFGDDTGVITWQSGRVDSPKDVDSSRVAVHVLRQSNNDFAGAYTDCSGIENRLVGAVRNLSFDFLNDSTEPSVHVGAGAPRYSVDIDTNGDGSYDLSAFLSAFHCQAVLPENPAWSRADFTGRILPGCSIFVDNVQYTSDGVKSAWRLYADANPTHKVMSWKGAAYLVMDEEGTAFVDRLAFHNKMFVKSGSGSAAVKTCANETSC